MTESESEHVVKAREFVDSILEINRDHGVDTEPAVIEYHIAIETAVNTFRYLREDSAGSGSAEPD